MKRVLGAVIVVGVFALGAAASEDSFKGFLKVWEEGALKFVNGDATQWKRNSSHTAQATIFGAFGGYERGWQHVAPRYDWAAAQFKGKQNENRVEYLAVESDRNLAYTVSIEHKQAKLGSQQEKGPQTFRVTQIFRREKGEWKLVHRHADPLIEKVAPR